MLPTAKDSTLLPTSPETSERTPGGATAGPQISNAQPVTLEVPVTVNGARAVEGSDKREPFSETTSTVLVLINGAVIRLSSAVAPGQLLFLTNDKTKKEVVCQVVKSKHYRSASGYVELEFTEPVLGFWGMRFPGERSGTQSSPAARKLASPSLPAGLPAANAEPKPTLLVDAKPVENITTNLADDVQEFKTEIKADERPSSKADFLAPAEASTVATTLDANRLEQQLSELLSAEEKQSEGFAVSAAPPSKQELGDAAAKIFDMASEEPAAARVEAEPARSDLTSPAPAAPKDTLAPPTSSFDAEEVKIPAWLEPLARNAAIPAPPAETAAGDSEQFEEWQAPQAPESASAAKQAQAPVAAKKTARTSKRTQATPVFGKTLLGESAPTLTGARRSGKGIWMAVAASLIAAAASGAWYFRDSWAPVQSSPASNASQASTASASLLPPVSNTQSAAGVTPSSTPMEVPEATSQGRNANSGGATVEAPAPASSVVQGKMQTAAITERISKPGSKNDLSTGPAKSAEPDESEIQRPSLGEIRLAKPKVRRSNNVQANGEMEPALEENSSELPGGENSLGANLADSSKQPAAPPAPVGGDVKPARLISSAPPSYPALARTQHIAGDVRIDALIDATGRVTTMKVVSGPALLHQAAMDALRRWKYEAATLDGKPVAMHLTVTIQFHLQ
jgi:protein TonB